MKTQNNTLDFKTSTVFELKKNEMLKIHGGSSGYLCDLFELRLN
ncbi:hypothetical protein N7U66_12615 [Lacinutrix neustonica]|uniref:Uncharacterized protein n=1 Tax=Lacinutrix neustonica TaxID=2980107 RepID=A0A9E8MT72_9FLAO|nr:hypothetical protein [Lacinutrix neustonica]WAC01018.1 hypothetical protein N7U66_12615 [Lacinutrix neustonica]